MVDHVLSSDEDEDTVEMIQYERKPCTVRPRVDNFEKWGDREFVTRFRLTKK